MHQWTTSPLLALIALSLSGHLHPSWLSDPSSRPLPQNPLRVDFQHRQQHHYEIALEEGHFTTVRVEQLGVDISVQATDHKDRTIGFSDRPTFNSGLEVLVLLAEQSGVFKLTIRSTFAGCNAGRYRIWAEHPRPATAVDVDLAKIQLLQERINRNSDTSKLLTLLRQKEAIWQRLRVVNGVVGTQLARARLLIHAGQFLEAQELLEISASRVDQARLISPDEGGLSLARRNPRALRFDLASTKALLFDAMGEPGRALEVLRAATDDKTGEENLAEGSIHPRWRLGTVQQMAMRHSKLDEWRETAGALRRSMKGWRNLGHKEYWLRDARLLALALANGRQHDSALVRLDEVEALGACTRQPQREQAQLHITRAWIQQHQGRDSKARGSLDLAEKLSIQNADYRRSSIELLKAQLTRVSTARRNHLRNAIRFSKATNTVSGAAKEQLAWLELIDGNPRNALRIAQDLVSRFPDSTAATPFSFVPSFEPQAILVDSLATLHQRLPSRGFDNIAFQADRRRHRPTAAPSPARRRARQQVRSVLGDLPEQESRRSLALPPIEASAPSPTGHHRSGPFQLTSLLLKHRTLQHGSPPHQKLQLSSALQQTRSFQRLMAADEAWLQFALGPRRSFLFLVTRESLELIELPKRDTLDPDAERLFNLLARPGLASLGGSSEIERLSRRLGRTLLGAVEERILGRRLSIVADGKLSLIPFGVLSLSDGPDWRPLIEDFEIRYPHPVASLDRPRGEVPHGSVAVFADPVFALADARMPSSPGEAVTAAAEPTRPGEVTRAIETLGGRLDRLSGTSKEARAIVAHASPELSFLATGFDANRELALSDRLSSYQVVHFATHGVINRKHPELSGLILSLYNPQGQPIPGFLHALDLADLQLQAELVVMSACQTAVGDQGRAMAGLAQGLLHNGVPSVVGSLWQSDDAGSAALMDRFYGHLFGDSEAGRPLDPAAALRRAQLDLLRDPRWAPPYYWASWVVVTAAP